MAKNLIFAEKEAAFLKELVKQRVPFMIVGLSAAALQGAPVVTQDIDLWFKDLADPGIKRALKKVGGSYIPPTMVNPPLFSGKNLELFDIVTNMHGLDGFGREIKAAIEIPIGACKVKILSLERIIKSKESLKRQKDLLVLPVLKDVLAITLGLNKREAATKRKLKGPAGR